MLINIRAGEVPVLIRKTAEGIAGAFYEEGQRSERFRRTAPRIDKFCRREWPRHVETAIEALAALLGQSGIPERQKEEIAAAIFAFRSNATTATPKLSMRSVN